MKKLVPLIVILLFCLSARADYHYASNEGSDEYPYTSWETGAHLIQDAVDASSPHDTVYIGTGEWEQYVFTDNTDSIAIIGMGIDSTFWHWGGYHQPAVYLGDGCSIRNIKFQHTDNWRPLSVHSGASVSIRDCKFVNSHIGAHVRGGNTEVVNCVFDSCETGIFIPNWQGNFFISNNCINSIGSANEGILLWVNSAIVQNNIIVLDPQGSNSGIISSILEGPVILRNNIVINGVSSYAVDSDQQHNNLTYSSLWGHLCSGGDSVYNNVSVNCRDRGFRLWDGTVHFLYNAAWNNAEDIYIDPSGDIDSIGNLFVNPMFQGTDDFHLQAFSPLIDAGLPTMLDVDGTRSDIGPYGGPYGCSYTYLDLAPQIPDSITVEVEEQLVTLNWRFNTEADFNRYQVFRDTVSGFTPSEFNMLAEPDTSYYEDQDIDPGTAYYYRLTSVDNQGNVSDFSDEVGFIPTDVSPFSGDGLPRYTVIESAYPNPFNSNVTIVYSASNLGPQPPQVKLQVFDIQGRVVRTLVDDRMPMGTYRAIWDGTNDSGEPVSSGTYIARVSQWGTGAVDFPVKITLIR
jgi:hypothetical protein